MQKGARSHTLQQLTCGPDTDQQRPGFLHALHDQVVGPGDAFGVGRQPGQHRGGLRSGGRPPLDGLDATVAPALAGEHVRADIDNLPAAMPLGQGVLDYRNGPLSLLLGVRPHPDDQIVGPDAPTAVQVVTMPDPQHHKIERITHAGRHMTHTLDRPGITRSLHHGHRIVIDTPPDDHTLNHRAHSRYALTTNSGLQRQTST